LQTTVPVNGLQFSTRDAFIDTGATFTGPGGLSIGTGRSLGIREGFSLDRDLTNAGTLAPGLQLGAVTVQSYHQFSTGRLNIQIASATPMNQQYADTQYDRLNVTGTAVLDGELSVQFAGTYSPQANDTFTVLTAGSILLSFKTFDLPLLPLGDVWNISETSTAYNLKIVYADFNHDGVVNMGDYILWRNTRNTSVTHGSGADANNDGFINDSDYAIWRANLGEIRGTASGAGSGSLLAGGVPEPASIALFACGALSLATLRRRQGSFRIDPDVSDLSGDALV
jgi:hypothetical protein